MTADPDRPQPAAHAATPGLYLIAVPIGNLRDITLRALDVLGAADVVACEDTRVTGKLLTAYGVNKTLLRYDEHSAARTRPEILARLAAGERVALVSDAGLPLISDPGYKLVRAARAAGHPVVCLPGPSAVPTALVVSGLPSDRFLFAGFPPVKTKARRTFFASFAAVPATLVFFESARRLAGSLADLQAEAGDREAAICRELTKLYEEVRSGPLSELAAACAAGPPLKGEITLVVGPPEAEGPALSDAALDAALRTALQSLSLRDAVARVAVDSGRRKREVYERALALAGEAPEPDAEPGEAAHDEPD
ncbi:MAG: 16S rRNA (cytidine(1402)-2'-O)-methyltransferase [Alphaproteobacteria bacterium]|jgi:16S rRNA (cytidine1402-2'-O)-methyltransferase|nr:16S rRNA (cytidine(1402)-2'-O)-methyltransferase [Alphaproteobacteria bacterium]